MDIKVILALIGGAVLGWFWAYVRIRSGLDGDEWTYLLEFYKSLKAGNYERVEDDSSDE